MNAMLQARTPDTTPWLTPTDIATGPANNVVG